MPKVVQYALAWHPQQEGKIRVKYENQGWGSWLPVSSEGLAAFAAVMREGPVHASGNGWVRTGPEPVDDEED